MIDVIHRIDRPFAVGVIEIYGDPNMGWWEWRMLERGAVIHDTKEAGYGSPGIALRDALNHDEPPPGDNRAALEGLAAGLSNLALHYCRMAAHHEIKAKPVPPSALDEVASSIRLMRLHLLDAVSHGHGMAQQVARVALVGGHAN
nr:hypothetical protein [Halomonas socia]